MLFHYLGAGMRGIYLAGNEETRCIRMRLKALCRIVWSNNAAVRQRTNPLLIKIKVRLVVLRVG